jgi:hypothetical protein
MGIQRFSKLVFFLIGHSKKSAHTPLWIRCDGFHSEDNAYNGWPFTQAGRRA